MGIGFASLGTAERLWWLSAAGFLLAFLVMVAVQLFDTRLLAGESVWAKPLKFAISLSVHFATVAIAVNWLRPGWTGSGWMTTLATISIAAAVFEIAYIALQGARAMPSHFNVTSPLYTALYAAMAVAAVVVLLPTGVVGVLAAVDGGARWPPGVRVGVAIGFIGGAVLTLITAFRLGGNMSHFIGAPPTNDWRVPLTGWSFRGADLRPAHFLATHMAQVVPVVALIAALALPARLAIVTSALAGAGWTALTLIVFANALAGRSLADLMR